MIFSSVVVSTIVAVVVWNNKYFLGYINKKINMQSID